MNLGELKKSLSKFPEDMDECEVLFTFITGKNKPEYDHLAFVAYAEAKQGTTCVILGTMKAAVDRMKSGTLHYADGSSPAEEGFDINE